MTKNTVEPERQQATWRLRVAYWISKATSAQAHECTRVPTPTSLDARAITHSLTHARACTHAHIHKYVILIALPQQQWFREGASLLRYTYIACLVACIWFSDEFIPQTTNIVSTFVFTRLHNVFRRDWLSNLLNSNNAMLQRYDPVYTIPYSKPRPWPWPWPPRFYEDMKKHPLLCLKNLSNSPRPNPKLSNLNHTGVTYSWHYYIVLVK